MKYHRNVICLNNWHGEYSAKYCVYPGVAIIPINHIWIVLYNELSEFITKPINGSPINNANYYVDSPNRIVILYTNHRAPKRSQIFTMTSIATCSRYVNRASVIGLIKIASWYREVTCFNENIYASTEVDGFGFDLT